MRGCLDVIQQDLNDNLQPFLFVFSIISLLLCIFHVVHISMTIVAMRNEGKIERFEQSQRKIRMPNARKLEDDKDESKNSRESEEL